jgi:hypothetical protein
MSNVARNFGVQNEQRIAGVASPIVAVPMTQAVGENE